MDKDFVSAHVLSTTAAPSENLAVSLQSSLYGGHFLGFYIVSDNVVTVMRKFSVAE